MPELMKRERKRAPIEPVEVFDPFDRMFERIFEDWDRWLWPSPMMTLRRTIPVDEYRENHTLVVRAELPGIDPDKDLEIKVFEGMLRIRAEWREAEEKEGRSYRHHELRSGPHTRTLVLPEGTPESEVKASYKDGILEIRIPVGEAKPATKVPIAKG